MSQKAKQSKTKPKKPNQINKQKTREKNPNPRDKRSPQFFFY